MVSDTFLSSLATPYDCRKYLRDADRQVLAQRAFILTVKVLEDTLSELAEVHHPFPSPQPTVVGLIPPFVLPCPHVPIYEVVPIFLLPR